jgi:hypothetical protein
VLNSVCVPKDTVEDDDSDASIVEPSVLVENEKFGTLNLTYLGLLSKKVCFDVLPKVDDTIKRTEFPRN